MIGGPPSHIGGTGGLNHRGEVKRTLETPEGCRDRPGPSRRGGSHLTTCHPIDTVIDTDDHHVNVTPRRMDQVVSPDRGQVAVTTDHHDVLVGQVQFDTRRIGDGPPVRCVEDIGIEVWADHPCRAPNTRYKDKVIHAQVEIVDASEN